MLQAFVSEAVKPLLDVVLTYGAGHFYVSQSDKGGLVFGGAIDGYNTYAQRGTLPMAEEVAAAAMTLLPGLARLKVLRQWGGVMDMTMDGSPHHLADAARRPHPQRRLVLRRLQGDPGRRVHHRAPHRPRHAAPARRASGTHALRLRTHRGRARRRSLPLRALTTRRHAANPLPLVRRAR